MYNGIQFPLSITLHSYFIILEVGGVSVSCHGDYLWHYRHTPVWTEGLGFSEEQCEDKYTFGGYIHGTIYSVLPLTYKILLETLCMSDS